MHTFINGITSLDQISNQNLKFYKISDWKNSGAPQKLGPMAHRRQGLLYFAKREL